MAAYCILTQKVDDLGVYREDYIPHVLPLLERHGIDVVVGHFDASALEGTADSVVVLRADSEEVFHAFYDDPDYTAAKRLRHSITSNADMIAAPEFTAEG